ncbi:MAG TPA: hypothetical protein DEP72_08000 [Clostridiales bacterium]|nr:MAG: hypothetical protein A2Y18_01125 [Clostridiales bacterium GWD2_32_19]HCC08078.1 hypothetical protein [Clostridiales bacterium]
MSDNKKGFGLLKGLGVVASIGGLLYAGYKATEIVKKKLNEEGIIIKVKSIVEMMQKDNRVTLDFNKLITEDWESMYIFGSYTSYKEIFEVIGFEWEEVYKTNINHDDNINLLLFIDDNKVVKYIEYPISYGDFGKLNADIYSSKNAVFELENINGDIELHEKVGGEE